MKKNKTALQRARKRDEDRLLPPLEVGQTLHSLDVNPEQSFTKPPPRFTEASLVKELEKLGIGRPSTYATIMKKIQSRDYTVKEKGTLKPTELGRVIAKDARRQFQAHHGCDVHRHDGR